MFKSKVTYESSFAIKHNKEFTAEQREEIAKVIANKVFEFEKGTDEVRIHPVGVYKPDFMTKVYYTFKRKEE